MSIFNFKRLIKKYSTKIIVHITTPGQWVLVEPSPLWYDTFQREPEPLQPTETELLTDYIIDVDYRVTMIELGL